MPQLSEIVKNRKKFKKVSYRAWDINGEWLEENTEPPTSLSGTSPVPFESDKHISALITPSNNSVIEKKETSVNFLSTNRPQIDHMKSDKKELIRNETDHKGVLNRSLKLNETNIENEIDHKETLEQITVKALKREEIDHNFELSTIVGKERELLFFIFSSCIKNRSTISEPLTLEHICRNTTLRLTSIKTTINRLSTKNLIIRAKGKKGRSGWMRFELPNIIYNEILIAEKESKWILNRSQKEFNQITEKITEQNTRSLSSSSNYINTTTDTKDDNFSFSDEWKYIDIEPLAEIGFTDAQLKQLARAAKLTPTEVQESVYAFAYARKLPEIAKSIRTNHLNFLMGVLIKKGEPYLPPTGYKSPLDIAIQEDIERKKKKLALEAELNDLKFQEWYNFLSKEEKENLFIQELTDQEKELYFDKNARYMPEHVKENKRKEVLRPYFMNVIRIV